MAAVAPLRGRSRRLGIVATCAALISSVLATGPVVAYGPSTEVKPAAGQAFITNVSPINFTVTFSDPVEGFIGQDVVLDGNAGGTLVATVTGGPNAYNLAVSGMTTAGVVFVRVPDNVAFNPAGEPNFGNSGPYHGVSWAPGPLVSIDLAPGQADPTGTAPVNWTVSFQDPVEGFTSSDVIVYSDAGGSKVVVVTGGPKIYDVAVSGMTTGGYLFINVPASVAHNPLGDGNAPATGKVLMWAPGGPSVTINEAAGQADPTGASPITFTVAFSAAVTGFTAGDVSISGTAGGTKTVAITGSGPIYTVAVTGMTTAGTVVASVAADVAVTTGQIADPGDPLGDESIRPNRASTSTDNVVTWMPAAQGGLTLTTSAPIPPGAQLPTILWGQGFTLGVEFGTTGANRAVLLEGTRDGTAWTPITTLTTDAVGHASLLYRPVTNLFYRAVFAGAPDLAAVTSNEVRTVVRQLAVMRPTNAGSTKTISRNGSITFSTTVRPSRPELAPATVTFSFYRQVSGSWQLATSRAVAVDSAGVARTTFQFTTVGQWYVRSQAGPTPYNANSVPTPIERYGVR